MRGAMVVKGTLPQPVGKGAILLIQLGDIGDVVLTMPTVRALRRHFPDGELFLCVREHARELAEDCPWVDGVISVDKRRRTLCEELTYQIGFLTALRRPRFQWAIDLRTGSRGAIAALLSGAPCRAGRFSDDGPLWRNRLFTHLIKPESEIHQYAPTHSLNIIAPFGVPTDDAQPRLTVPAHRKDKALHLLREAGVPASRPILAIHPFSLWRYKEWQPNEWASLIGRIIHRQGFSVVITGSPTERIRAEALTKRCSGPVFNLAGKTSIGELPALLSTSDLFIGVDTAALHIAAAVNVPTIGIFGPSSPAAWAPKGEQHAVITRQMPCQPCRDKGCYGTEKSRCLDELKAEDVLSIVESRLQSWAYTS